MTSPYLKLTFILFFSLALSWAEETAKEDPASQKAKSYLETSFKKFAEYDSMVYQTYNRTEKNEVFGYTTVYTIKAKDGSKYSRHELYSSKKSGVPFSVSITNPQGDFEIVGKTALQKEYFKQKAFDPTSVSDELQFNPKFSYEESTIQNLPVIKIIQDYSEADDEKRLELKKIVAEKAYGININPDKKTLTRKIIYYLRKSDLFSIMVENYLSDGTLKSKVFFENIQLNVPLDNNLFDIPKGIKVEKLKSPGDYEAYLLKEKNIKSEKK